MFVGAAKDGLGKDSKVTNWAKETISPEQLKKDFDAVLLTGGGMLYLTTLESRWSRHKIMEHLHELRSIVHVIDMHQLPKDPSSDRPATVAVPEGCGALRAGQQGQSGDRGCKRHRPDDNQLVSEDLAEDFHHPSPRSAQQPDAYIANTHDGATVEA